MREIVLAGGCYWGVEKYLSNLRGVVSTEVGFANGHTEHPSYEQVKYEHTGHAEAVWVHYDEKLLPLPRLLSLFFRIIDPTSVDRQGHDEGHQYRTGIYWTDAADEAIARQSLAQLAERYAQPLVVECEPLQNFTTAEEYHQRYLDKNPGGYCHVPWELIEWAKQANGTDEK